MSDRDNDADDNGEHDDHDDVVVVVVVTISNALRKLCKIQLVPQQGHHHFLHQGAELF